MKTLKQASKLTGIHQDNLRQRIYRGTLKSVKKGRDWFISGAEIKKITNQDS